jgi:hypothetical protein
MISGRDRRLLIFGGTTIVALITLARGLPALREWERRKLAEAGALAADLAAARDGRRALPMLRDSLAARRTRLAALDSTLLTGVSPAAAAAELTAFIERCAADARLTVGALQIYSDSARPGTIARVRVRVAGVTDVTGLAAFVRAVEGADTPLVVRELVVVQPDPAGPDSKPETLRIEALVEGIAMIRRDGP